MNDGKREILYINGLKGFACLMVMVGHYSGFYKYAEFFPVRIDWFDMIFKSKLGFLLSESFWLYLFFIISGYLLMLGNVNNVSQMIKKIILRFVRLGVPVLFSSVLIYSLLYKTVGFLNNEAESLIDNSWFQGYYTHSYTFKDAIVSPFRVLLFGDVVLNPPYWCLNGMFVAAILIYFYKWSSSILSKKAWFYILVIIILGSLHIRFDGVRTACLFGVVAYVLTEDYYKNDHELFISWQFNLSAILLALLLYIFAERVLLPIVFIVFMIFCGRCSPVRKMLSSTSFQWLGKMSWGIYSFHFPIFSSLGMKIIMSLSTKMGGVLWAYLFSVAVCIIVTGLFSVIYHYTFERFTSWLMTKCKGLMHV